VLVSKLWEEDSVGYTRIYQDFRSRVQDTSTKPRATVVDLFSGIGAGLLCLKRLRIKIDTVIHVEHCNVANAVYQYHHGQPDGQKHVFLRKFEQFEDELQDLMKKHGRMLLRRQAECMILRTLSSHLYSQNSFFSAFDIIIAGPPCVDYATINANRKGAKGQQGSYLCRTGNVIRGIMDHNRKVRHADPFFLVENVALTEEDQADVREAFQQTGHVMFVKDSADHTPLARKRTFLSNIPLLAEEKLEDPPPGLCFEDGYDVAGKIFDPSLRHMKAPGLMANKGRLDDYPRMLIFKEVPDQRYLNFHARTPRVSEREKLMGFPPGYVSQPCRCQSLVRLLFP
jgi:site-specific DNA-cytosine methylase